MPQIFPVLQSNTSPGTAFLCSLAAACFLNCALLCVLRTRTWAGEHIVRKPFEFVSSTLHNKKSFIQLVERALVGFRTTFQGEQQFVIRMPLCLKIEIG